MQVYGAVAGYKMSVGKCYVRWGVGAQPAVRRTGLITDEELQSLNLKFECAGCGRKEATMASRRGHERNCPYISHVRHWHNPVTMDDDDDGAGTWEVERVLQLRGPPEARYAQLLWAPTDLDLDAYEEHHEFVDLEDADGQPRSGDGSWTYGWQPMANCLHTGTSYSMSHGPGRSYRYYNATPLFKFGEGLSLTSFSFDCDSGGLPGPSPLPIYRRIIIICNVKNTGTMIGDEVLQVYHSAGENIRAVVSALHLVPLKQLVEFVRHKSTPQHINLIYRDGE